VADVFDARKRSEVMRAIRSKYNKTTELALVAAMKVAHVQGWRRHVPFRLQLGGAQEQRACVVRPDFTFRASRLVVFVDGCFWHRCPRHATAPKSNVEYWTAKLERNFRRDRAVDAAFRRKGWSVMRIWEHDLGKSNAVVRRLCRRLRIE
jgi:DNA mismatch endonuclease, patch repair protein